MRSVPNPRTLLVCAALALVLGACGDDDESDLDSEADAEHAYLGLDGSIEKTLDLGMDGFNAASNANIPTQSGVGDVSGTITVDGQVDQGASDNKGMRLDVALDEYSDGPIVHEHGDDDDHEDLEITYYTNDGNLPHVELSLRDIPDGTLTGTLIGTYEMHGDIEGEATLDLQFDGTIQDDGSGGVTRTPGGTHVTGVATAGDAHYDVDVQI